ncbi:hypothetical protein [Lysobacter sp. CA196]|uniref:hypothetical protein n=1 Tax=Lysobacter sp. CA196 TaxID=3455606 RepID=UPI003F8D1A37
MNMHSEQHEAVQSIEVEGLRVRAGLRVASAVLLAGAPIALSYFVEVEGPGRLHLAVGGDRAKQRPAGFGFRATLAGTGTALADPCAGVPDLGGPIGLVVVAADTPWRQTLLLNQFVALENSRRSIAEGEHDLLTLTCRRALKLATNEDGALDLANATPLELTLSFALERDDATVAAIAATLAQEIFDGPIERREPALSELFAMRDAARTQIRALTQHPQAAVAERAKQVLDALESVS